jgi:hypothetical protein
VHSILFLNGGTKPKITQADFVAATLEDAAEWIVA